MVIGGKAPIPEEKTKGLRGGARLSSKALADANPVSAKLGGGHSVMTMKDSVPNFLLLGEPGQIPSNMGGGRQD